MNSGTTSQAWVTFPKEAILIGVEAENVNCTPGDIFLYLRTYGTVLACAVPISHKGPAKVISEDIKIPIDGRQELVADFRTIAVGDVCWLRAIFYIKDGSTDRLWWK